MAERVAEGDGLHVRVLKAVDDNFRTQCLGARDITRQLGLRKFVHGYAAGTRELIAKIIQQKAEADVIAGNFLPFIEVLVRFYLQKLGPEGGGLGDVRNLEIDGANFHRDGYSPNLHSI